MVAPQRLNGGWWGKLFSCLRYSLIHSENYGILFDGDEMNLYHPQTLTSLAEISALSSPASRFISPQSSKPNIAIVQDALLGCYLMTLHDTPIPKTTFNDIVIHAELNNKPISIGYISSRLKQIKKVYKTFGKNIPLLCGKTLLSLLLPPTFNYTRKNEARLDEPILKIKGGVIYEGAITKSIISNTQSSILVYLCKEYSNELALEFVNNVQWYANDFLLYSSFSISLHDCLATKKSEINDYVLKGLMSAQLVNETIANPNIREARINTILSNVKELGMRIATSEMKKPTNIHENGFIQTIVSGSKGDYFNIAQITGLLGQQNLADRRLVPVMCKGKRTFPYYPMNEEKNEEEHDVKKKYESRGYVRHSLIRGLNPIEFFIHAMTGRATLVTTAMNTQNSGYIQRRMTKIMEDTGVRYDGTIRDGRNKIVQFLYGDDGLDRTKTLIRSDIPEVCDVSRICERLNDEVENKQKQVV